MQQPAIAPSAHPVVSLVDGQAVTTSLEVARVFGKRHDDVLRGLDNVKNEWTLVCLAWNLKRMAVLRPQ